MEDVHLHLEAAIGGEEEREQLLNEIIPLLSKFTLTQLRDFNDSIHSRLANETGEELPNDYENTYAHLTLDSALSGADQERLEEFLFFFSLANCLSVEALDTVVGEAQDVLKKPTNTLLPSFNEYMKHKVAEWRGKGLNHKDAYKHAYADWQAIKSGAPEAVVTVRATSVHTPTVRATTVHTPTVHTPTIRTIIAPTVHNPTVQASTHVVPSFTGPNAYQKYLQWRLPQLKAEGLTGREAFSTAAMEWKEMKA